MKDFFDIWFLSRQFDFDGDDLAEAIRLTLDKRGTPLPAKILAFTVVFAEDKQIQWAAFHRRLAQTFVPADFKEIILAVEVFLWPITEALSTGKGVPQKWTATGPWA